MVGRDALYDVAAFHIVKHVEQPFSLGTGERLLVGCVFGEACVGVNVKMVTVSLCSRATMYSCTVKFSSVRHLYCLWRLRTALSVEM